MCWDFGFGCRDVIERIITLGFYYRELDRFAAKSRNLSWIRSPNESPLLRTSQLLKGKASKQSLYRRAIANGIVEVLSVYRSAVLHIEQKLLSDALPIVATLTQGLNKVSRQFPLCNRLCFCSLLMITLLMTICLLWKEASRSRNVDHHFNTLSWNS